MEYVIIGGDGRLASPDGKKSDTAVPPSRDSDRRSGRSSALPYPPSEQGEYTTLCLPLPLA